MHKHTRSWLLVGLLGLLVACSGGGGGNSAQGVDPGPPPPGGSVPPPPPELPNPSPYAEAEELLAYITDVTLNDNDQAVVQFQLTDGKGIAITDLTADDVRFVISKLRGSPLGNLTGTWQSYANSVKEPEVGTGTEAQLQAIFEFTFGSWGEFTNNGDGTYTYRYATSLTDLPQDVLDQAAVEGLNLDYEPDRPHRVAIQFDGSDAGGWANPNYDWVPATGATDGIFTMDIAATDNCNRCHDPLAIHGGGRREIKYCVTCHNTGSTDPDSTNTVDMKVMIHKLHMGRNLPSVQAGGEYVIYGYKNSKHDYSNLQYPQDIRNCVNCHVGTGTVGDRKDLVLTSQGDNWAEYPTAAACGSCHDDKLGPDDHIGSKPDDSGCASCHSEGGRAGSVQDSHRMLVQEAREAFEAKILNVTNTGPGETPVATFKVTNPLNNDEPYDILNDPVWTNSNSSLSVRFAWSTTDYTNTGNGSDSASSISTNALEEAVDNGDGSYRVNAPQPIPNGSEAPHIAATGSGVAVIEGRSAIEGEEEDVYERVPLTNVHRFFSIDEADGDPDDRRKSVELESCLACHSTLSFHGGNRNDDIDDCVTCHNPRYYSTRNNKSVDFKVLIHTLHGDEDQVDYPGNLGNCTACHTDDGYTLPLASTVLGTTVNLGNDLQDPRDDTVTTPTTAVCSSCHDDSVATAHMTSNGGSFNTTQAAIDSGQVVEECSVCHGTGRSADVTEVHDIP